MDRPLLLHELPEPVEHGRRVGRQLRPQRLELGVDLEHARAQLALPPLGQHTRRRLDDRAVRIPLGLELAFVRPAELEPRAEAAERHPELARRSVTPVPIASNQVVADSGVICSG